MNPLNYFWTVLKAFLLSTGGFGPLPSIHQDLVPFGYAQEGNFAEALAVGQLSPGPNGLWVVALGYLIGGLPLAIVAALAATLPPLLILLIQRVYQRIAHHPATHGFLDGLALAIIGVGFVVLGSLLFSNGYDLKLIGIAAFGTIATLLRRLPSIVIIAIAAGAAVLAWSVAA